MTACFDIKVAPTPISPAQILGQKKGCIRHQASIMGMHMRIYESITGLTISDSSHATVTLHLSNRGESSVLLILHLILSPINRPALKMHVEEVNSCTQYSSIFSRVS